MSDSRHDLVIRALGRHLQVDPLAIEGRQGLDDDWGLDALDLTLLAIRLEDELEVELDMGALAEARTVADLVDVARAAGSGRPASDELGLGPRVGPQLREEVRRSPRRARRASVHRQLRRALRRDAA